MRLSLSTVSLLSLCTSASAFGVGGTSLARRGPATLRSTIESTETTTVTEAVPPEVNGSSSPEFTMTAEEINSRLAAQLDKLRAKDQASPALSKEDIKVAFEDDHIIVVEKPAGVLCVPTKNGDNNIAQSVFDSFGAQLDRADKMVVHRLGMDTSGLVVFAKTLDAVRGMNTIFRTRKIERTYEALVCGHIDPDSGMISLPLMRDYQFPPFMRVSTDAHQKVLASLDVADVGKKLLQQPKDSLTKYEVVEREEIDGQPVTRVSLTSVSGRTHQLNVHLAAFGHPIVGDATYGMGGDAAANGGLSAAEQESLAPNPGRADAEVQKSLSGRQPACVHAKSIKFRHPVTKEQLSISCASPF